MQYSKFEVFIPGKIEFGENSITGLGEICKEYGTSCLLVTDPKIENAYKKVFSLLESENISFDKCFLSHPEPKIDYIDSLRLKFKKKYDCIIALGGGSSIDTAKALSIGLTNPEPIWEYANLSYRPPKSIVNETIPIVAIPTTSGSGSEVTPYAVINNQEIKQRGTIQLKNIIPKHVFVDPIFLTSMPKEITASTGMDALAHVVESQFNISKISPMSDLLGKESLKIIFEFLPLVLNEPQNIEYRLKMAYASTLAGITISHRGTTIAHGIAETMGGLIGIPHGKCVAMATLPVLEMTLEKKSSLIQKIYNDLNNDKKNHQTTSRIFLEKLSELIKNVGMDKQLKDILGDSVKKDINHEILDSMLKYKFRPMKQHAVNFEKSELLKMISKITGI